ncbi:MAG: filamentous hemagglutinin N-terminal domain-containing protein [Calothrix sp. CSU_2_0]|nr:filamentous hemagglutinin N-terminal domain-containing protein [Calothrix sp. CSU_2_0]
MRLNQALNLPLHLSFKIAVALGIFGLVGTPVFAQSNIVPDSTLGTENSRVEANFNNSPTEVITGGATRGINLFHSFQQFNVSEGREAYFLSPSADIQNILARVTGGNRSEILGRLGTFGNSQPNLFLINPNGIIFGEKASLNVQGSFVATTANGVQFGNQGNFSATNPQAAPLLTINPSALLFNQINQGEIINRSRQIATLGSFYLIGGDITFDGGVAASFGNRLELGAVAETGTVELIGSDNQMQLAFPEGLSKADIVLQNNALVATTGGDAITVNARNISLFGSFISSVLDAGEGQPGVAVGDVVVNATGDVTLDNLSNNASALTSGGGAITVNARNISLSGSFISSVLDAGEGQPGVAAGDVVVNATGDVTLDNLSSIASRGFENSLGDTGNVTINAQSIRLTNQSIINTNGSRSQGNIILNAKDNVSLDGNSLIGTFGIFNSIGKSGDITITTRNINLSNESGIDSFNVVQGQGGKITLKAEEAISLTSGSDITSSSVSLSGGVNNQPSGDIEIRARKLSVDGSAKNTVISSENLDDGKAGNIQIIADDLISLNGLASISSSTYGQGDGGNIELQTRSLTVTNGGKIDTRALGRGNSGNLLVNALDSVTLSGIVTFIDPQTGESFTKSGLFSSVEAGSAGNAGDLTINTQDLLVRDGAVVSTATSGAGRGGNLTINADRGVQLIGTGTFANDNFPSGLFATAEAGSIGNAGDLTINTQDLLVRDGARVSTETSGVGKGGNLLINADRGVQLIGTSTNGRLNSILSTSANQGLTGNAGDLTIDTQDLLVRDGAKVGATTFGQGKGGNLTVNANGSVQLIGTDANGNSSGLFASTEASSIGNAGELTINTPDLLVRDGAVVSTVTFGVGRGGNLTINADRSVQLMVHLLHKQIRQEM